MSLSPVLHSVIGIRMNCAMFPIVSALQRGRMVSGFFILLDRFQLCNEINSAFIIQLTQKCIVQALFIIF